MRQVEVGFCLSKKDTEPGITQGDIVKKFGFDYRPVVMERLKHWGKLPDDHTLNFFSVAEFHKGSSGLYLLEEKIGDSWIFVQAMFGKGISTKHKHGENVVELYDPLAGQSLLNVDGIDQELNPGVPFEVLPGQVHRLRTEEKPSLNLLIMKNSAHIPRNQLHIPVA